MSTVDDLGRLAGRLTGVTEALASQAPWVAPVWLLAEAVGLLAHLPGDAAAKAALQEHRRSRTSRQLRHEAILDLVAGEIGGLAVLEVAELDDAAPRIAGELLADDAEALAGAIARQIEAGAFADPAQLAAAVTAWLEQRLQPCFGEDEARVLARRLGDDLVAALWQEQSFQELVSEHDRRLAQRFQEEINGRLDRVYRRLGLLRGIAEQLQGLRSFVDDLARWLGRPGEDQLDKLCRVNRPLVLRQVQRSFRQRLCSPLPLAEIDQALRREGRSGSGDTCPVPQLFSYLPHTLAQQPEEAEHRHEEPEKWPALGLQELLGDLGSGSGRLLLVGPAGFGKSTFLDFVAIEVLRRSELLVLPPVTLRSWPSGLAITVANLVDWQADLLDPAGLPAATVRQALAELLRRGRVLLLVDGLDQVAGGWQRVSEAVARHGDLGLVATRRQELAPHRAEHCYDRVLALRAPQLDEVSEAELPPVVRDLLASLLDEEEQSHPFWIHVARTLHHHGCLPVAGRGAGALLEAHLDELLRLGAERAGRQVQDPGAELRRTLALARQVVAGLALDSLRFTASPQAPLQELAGELLERDAATLARDLGLPLSRRELETGLGLAIDDAFVVYRQLTEPSTSGRAQVSVFHHQLLQEYLAARGLVERACSEGAVAGRLAELVADLVQPRGIAGRHPRRLQDAGRGEEVPDRVRSLRLWRFAAEQLAAAGSPLTPAERGELVRELTRVLWRSGGGEERYGGACRSALLRLRDELLECDHELAGWATQELAPDLDRHFGNDPVWRQCAGQPDPFQVLLWSEERRLIGEQLDRVPPPQEVQRLLQEQEPGRPWAVHRQGATIMAVTQGPDRREQRWLLVPPGPFLAGSWELDRELPVRQLEAGGFWIAEDPVTVAEYAAFVDNGGYDLDQPWWQPMRAASEKVLTRRGRREPRGWQEQRSRTDLPVTGITWFEAVAYCRWRNQDLTGLCGGPYRLPAEAEWEKAARGLLGRPWSWGGVWRPDLVVCGEEGSPSRNKIAAVMINSNQSPFSVQGMAGNIWEWTSTRWQDQDIAGSTREEDELSRVRENDLYSLRGCSFFDGRSGVRCAYRNGLRARIRLDGGGFRCVRDVS